MNLRALFSPVLVWGGIFFAPAAFAHSPFDCSARAIVHADSAEVSVTVGTALGGKFLDSAQLLAGQLPNGHALAINPEIATNFFEVSADGKILTPRAGAIITDGQEFEFHFDYALAPAKTLRLESKFLPELKSQRTAPLVLTDENGNVLGGVLLTPGKAAAEFALRENLFPAPVAAGPAGNPAAPAAEKKTRPAFGEFLRLGIRHILNVEAFDHLLFLTALLLGCQRLKPMLLVITGFTLAHSLTLTLAALNVATVSGRIIEPLIAASIIFVAAENFRRTEKSWPRYALTCGFGLIHGFGFASALRESGLGGTGPEIFPPLFAFNLGVEIGQLTVAAFLLPSLLWLNQWRWFGRSPRPD